MWLILFFRITIFCGFLIGAWKWGDWRNWQKYYSSMLFVAVVNMSVGYLSYHHSLWFYLPDVIVSTQTVVEFINTYCILPATTLIYLSNFPVDSRVKKYSFICMWVLIYGTLESIDHTIIGGISYDNDWSLGNSVLFDFLMFTTIRIHYNNPLLGWLIVFAGTIIIFTIFNFWSAEMK